MGDFGTKSGLKIQLVTKNSRSRLGKDSVMKPGYIVLLKPEFRIRTKVRCESSYPKLRLQE
jgi:hypothetical protein